MRPNKHSALPTLSLVIALLLSSCANALNPEQVSAAIEGENCIPSTPYNVDEERELTHWATLGPNLRFFETLAGAIIKAEQVEQGKWKRTVISGKGNQGEVIDRVTGYAVIKNEYGFEVCKVE